MLRRRALLFALVIGISIAVPSGYSAPRLELPTRLSDAEFWRIVETFSEPNGYFNSDNLVSNEDTFQYVIPALKQSIAPGGVYVGVGPDQNFTYIAAVQPAMAFIPDVRRGNLLVHLMYKALFELSADRAEFMSRLFSRPRPQGLTAASTQAELFRAYGAAAPDQALYDANLQALVNHLTRRRGFSLMEGDVAGIDFAYSSFFAGGPSLTFVSNGAGRRNVYPSYETLQMTTDRTGASWGYLSSEATYARVRSYQERNLIVPVVGNFAGPRALSSIATYLRDNGGVVTTFYTSNVEQYLFQDGVWDAFRANVARLPTNRTSTFIRSCFSSCSSPGGSRAVSLLDSIPDLLTEAQAGRVRSYGDVLNHSRAFR